MIPVDLVDLDFLEIPDFRLVLDFRRYRWVRPAQCSLQVQVNQQVHLDLDLHEIPKHPVHLMFLLVQGLPECQLDPLILPVLEIRVDLDLQDLQKCLEIPGVLVLRRNRENPPDPEVQCPRMDQPVQAVREDPLLRVDLSRLFLQVDLLTRQDQRNQADLVHQVVQQNRMDLCFRLALVPRKDP